MRPSTILIRNKVEERLIADKTMTNVGAEIETAWACGVSVLRVKRARAGKDT